MHAYQGRHGQLLAGKAATVEATWRCAASAAAAFYSAKSSQGLGLGGLASRGGPAYWWLPLIPSLEYFALTN